MSVLGSRAAILYCPRVEAAPAATGLQITVSFKAEFDTPFPDRKVEDTKSALRELGLGDDVEAG